ncbi:MAG: Fic family protein [Muricomes sp.]
MLLEDGISIGGRPIKDCFEAVGHGDAYDFMVELARQQDMNLTEEIVKNLHWLFYQKVDAEKAGRYRTVQAYISGTEYVPPVPEEVERFMGHLADQILSSRFTLHPIELAAMAHKRLLDIHPFTAGNSRICPAPDESYPDEFWIWSGVDSSCPAGGLYQCAVRFPEDE